MGVVEQPWTGFDWEEVDMFWRDGAMHIVVPVRLMDGVRGEAARQLADIRGRAILAAPQVYRHSVQPEGFADRYADVAEDKWRRDNPWMSELVGKLPATDDGDGS